jgi:hypothetical protein
MVNLELRRGDLGLCGNCDRSAAKPESDDPKLKHCMNRTHLRYNERVHHHGSTMRAIEATGILNTQGQLQLDIPRPQAKPSRVRIIMLISDDDDLNPGEWETAIATNPSFAFLHDPEEDIYTLEDGKPVSYEG